MKKNTQQIQIPGKINVEVNVEHADDGHSFVIDMRDYTKFCTKCEILHLGYEHKVCKECGSRLKPAENGTHIMAPGPRVVTEEGDMFTWFEYRNLKQDNSE